LGALLFSRKEHTEKIVVIVAIIGICFGVQHYRQEAYEKTETYQYDLAQKFLHTDIHKSTISLPQYFVVRDDILQFLNKTSRSDAYMVLLGPKRSGKSTMTQYFAKTQPGPLIHVPIADAPNLSDETVFTTIIQKMNCDPTKISDRFFFVWTTLKRYQEENKRDPILWLDVSRTIPKDTREIGRAAKNIVGRVEIPIIIDVSVSHVGENLGTDPRAKFFWVADLNDEETSQMITTFFQNNNKIESVNETMVLIHTAIERIGSIAGDLHEILETARMAHSLENFNNELNDMISEREDKAESAVGDAIRLGESRVIAELASLPYNTGMKMNEFKDRMKDHNKFELLTSSTTRAVCTDGQKVRFINKSCYMTARHELLGDQGDVQPVETPAPTPSVEEPEAS
jgi:energy-coupling factor transporter ATP-binding protein EcfA2